MIISNIIGGLGNQMFQYAFGKALSIQKDMQYKLSIDMFNNYKLHQGFELHRHFRISDPIASKKDMQFVLGCYPPPNFRRAIQSPLLKYLRPKNFFLEHNLNALSLVPTNFRSIYLQGYWQSEVYFQQIESTLRENFLFSGNISDANLKVLEDMKSGASVSIHVRRGDYLVGKNRNIYSQLGINFYIDSIDYLQKNFSNLTFFVFTDDPKWVVSNLLPKYNNIRIVDHNKGVESAWDMHLMSNADHHIIANSSFSWWGAWLNDSSNKIVIAPKVWYSNNRSRIFSTPSTWITM